ncbi:uncharacterized protein [Bemisia tabaci]
MDCSFKPEPMIGDHQLIGDSQLLRLSEQYLNGRRTNNRQGLCVSGQTILELYTAIQRRIYPVSPKIICMIGTNDLTRNSSIESMIDNMNSLVNLLLKERQVKKLILLTAPPVPKLAKVKSHWKCLRIFNDHIASLANGSSISVLEIDQLFLANHDSSPSYDGAPCRFPRQVPLPYSNRYGPFSQEIESYPPDFSRPPPCNPFQLKSSECNKRPTGPSLPTFCSSNSSLNQEKAEDLLCPQFLKTDSRSSVPASEPEMKPRVLEDMWDVQSIKAKSSVDSIASTASASGDGSQDSEKSKDPLLETWPAQQEPPKTEMDDEPTAPVSSSSPARVDARDNSSNKVSEISSLPLHDSATGDMENLKIKDSQPDTQSVRQKPIGADSPTPPVSTSVHSKTMKNSSPNKPKAFKKKLKSPLIKESKQEDQCVKNETDCEPEGNWDNEILGHGTKIPNKTSSQNLEDINNQCHVTNQEDEKTVKLNKSLRAGSQKPVVIPSKKDSGRQEGNLKPPKHRTCLNVIRDHIKDNSPSNKSASNASASSKVVVTSSEATSSSVNPCSPAQSDSSGDSYVSTPKVLKVNETDVSSAKFNQRFRAVGQQGNSHANKYMSSRGRGDRPLRKVPARHATPTLFPPCERKLLNEFETPENQCIPQHSSRPLRQQAFEDAGDSVMECEQIDSCELINQGDNGCKSNLGNTSDSSFLQEQVGPSGNQTFSGDASKTMQVTESSSENQSRLGDCVSKSNNESFYPGNNVLTNDQSEINAPEQKVPESSHLDRRLTQNSEGINEDEGNVVVPNVGKSLQQRVVVDDSSSHANYCRPTMHERKPQTVSSETSESTNSNPNQVLTEESNALPRWFPSNDAQPIPMTAALLMQVSDNNERSRVHFPGHTEIQGGDYFQQDSHRANHPANFESGWNPAAYPYSENRYSGVSAQFREQIYQPANVSNPPHHQSNQNRDFMENQSFEKETMGQLQTQSLNDEKFFNQQPYYGNQERVLTAVTTTFNVQYQQAQNFSPAFCNSMQDHMNMHFEKFPSIPNSRLRPAAPHFQPTEGIRRGNFYGPPTFHDSRAAERVNQHFSQRALPEPSTQRNLVEEISESNFNHLDWPISGAQANLPPEHIKSQFSSRCRRRGNVHQNYNCRSHQEVTPRALEHRDYSHQIPQKPEFRNYRPPQACPAQPEGASKTARYICQLLKNVIDTLEKGFQYFNLENVQTEKRALHSDLDIALSHAIKLKEAVEEGNFESIIMKEECEKEALIFASHFVDKDSESTFENDPNHILEQEPNYQDNMDRVGTSADNEKNEVPKTWSHESHKNLHLGELNKQVTSNKLVERSEIEKAGKISDEKSYNNGQRNKLPEPCNMRSKDELPLHQKDGGEAPRNESLEHHNSMSRPQNHKDMQVVSPQEFDTNVPTNELAVLPETLEGTKGTEDSAEAFQLQPTADVPTEETFKDSTKMEQSEGHENYKVRLHQNFENFSPKCEHLMHSKMTEKPMSQGNKRVVQYQKSGCGFPENSSNMRKPESKADYVDKENQKSAISPRSEPVQYHEKMKKVESDRDDKVTRHWKSNKFTPRNATSARSDKRGKHENLEATLSATGRKNYYHGGRNQANSSNIGRDLTFKEDSVIPYQKSNKSKSEIQGTQGPSAREHPNVSHKNRYFKRTKNEQLTEGKMQFKVESEGPRSPPEGNEKDRVNNDLKQRDLEFSEGSDYPKKSESPKNSELSVETTQHPSQPDENTEHVSPSETQYLNIAGNQLVADWEELDEFQKSPHDKIHNEQFSKNLVNFEGQTTNSPVSDKQRNQSSLDDGTQQYSAPLISVPREQFQSHAPHIPFEEFQQSENTGMFKYQERHHSGFWKIPEAAKTSKSYIDSVKAGSATSSNTDDRVFMASKHAIKDEVPNEVERSLQYNQENQRAFEKSDMQDFKHPGQWSDSYANRPSHRHLPHKARDIGAESTNWRSQQCNNQMRYSSSSEEEFPAIGARRSRRGRQRTKEAHEQRSNFTMPVRSCSAEGFPRMRFLSPPVPTQTRHFPDHDFSKIKMDNFELFFGSSYENPSPRQDLIHLNKKGLGMVFNLIKEKLSKEES